MRLCVVLRAEGSACDGSEDRVLRSCEDVTKLRKAPVGTQDRSALNFSVCDVERALRQYCFLVSA